MKLIYSFIIVLHLTHTIVLCDNKNRTFPKGFKWGIGSSSYQIEGGWDADAKGESIWDYMTHKYPEKNPDLSNGDIACDSYNKWERDVQMVKELGVGYYRFSISWPRILPTGYINQINKHAVRYYSSLIEELLKNNITPIVTIYHWDLPQKLQLLGGFTNPEIIQRYIDYSRLLFELFGSRVKFWITFNEPWHICEQSYGQDYMAPAMDYPGVPSYLCGHNLLKAHAEVVHMYRDEFQSTQKGVIGIITDISWPEPKTARAEDFAASERSLQFYIGWFAHPIFSKTGNYPKIMIDRIDDLSEAQGYKTSRLPKFTKEEIERIRGTSDFFGINSYTTFLTANLDRNNSAGHPVPGFHHDAGIIESTDPSWPKSGSEWLHAVPYGMYKLLKWIAKEYNNPIVYITENGVSDKGGTNDITRIEYFNSYLGVILDAINEGCNIQGYIAWSLMDSFEWRAGYTEKFGLYHVDFTTPNRTRTAKASSKVYANIVKTNALDWTYRPMPDIIINPPQPQAQTNPNGAALPKISILSILVLAHLIYDL